jgi:hypothetical protein
VNDGQLAERAHKAKTLLDNPMYQEGFEMVHKAIISRIEACPLGDVAIAEDLRKCLRLLRDVRANLEHAISQGKLISFRLEQEKAQEERIKKFHLIPNFYR